MFRALRKFLNRRRIRAEFEDRSRGFSRDSRKIVYGLTPPPRLSNIGDHAQVIAILKWFEKHIPGVPVLEVDKDETTNCIEQIKALVKPADPIFLHSGGNLGDRGMWSENARRLFIQSFPENQIISLPQTIFFSDTEKGRAERETTKRIYNQHDKLSVVARDAESLELAKELFPNAVTLLAAPDFVLALPEVKTSPEPPEAHVLFVMRRDTESRFTPEQRRGVMDGVSHSGTLWDTTLDEHIGCDNRDAVLKASLAKFQNASVVVTDRFHGLIFSVLCRTPCVVLPTVDHKLTSAIAWFQDVPYVFFTETVADIPELVSKALQAQDRTTPDWHALHFDPLAQALGLKTLFS